jgi:DNA-binding MarR family transcriptional regulator
MTKQGCKTMKQQDYVNLWATLVNTRDAISKLRQREMKQYHITAEQSGVLSILYSTRDSLTPAEISRRLIRDPSSVTVILNRMAAKGLINKSKDKKKKNLIRVTLTKKGDDLYSQILKGMCIYALFSVLSDEQCQQLQNCLNTLLAEAIGKLNWPFETATGRTI